MSSAVHWLACSPLGSGSFGHVSLALNLDDGSLCAAKSAASSSSPALLALQNEFHILRCLHSPFILRCLGAHFSPSPPSSHSILRTIFLEYMDGGSLAHLLKRSGGKLHDLKLVQYYTRAILQGLDYLHQHGIAHCDIKSHNILIGSAGVKIADFGAARRLNEPSAPLDGILRGTPLWMTPEVLQGVEQGTPSDIWSLGCTVLEMLQGRPPWAHISNLAALFLKVAGSQESPPPLPASISEEASDFLLQCFQRDPKERPTAAELLRHPFLCRLPEDAKNGMCDQPSPRSTMNFVQSDDESDWEDKSVMVSAPILGFSSSLTTNRGSSIASERQEVWKSEGDTASKWITVRSGEKWCQERQAPFMQAPEALQTRSGCDVSLECASFLRKRERRVG